MVPIPLSATIALTLCVSSLHKLQLFPAFPSCFPLLLSLYSSWKKPAATVLSVPHSEVTRLKRPTQAQDTELCQPEEGCWWMGMGGEEEVGVGMFLRTQCPTEPFFLGPFLLQIHCPGILGSAFCLTGFRISLPKYTKYSSVFFNGNAMKLY